MPPSPSTSSPAGRSLNYPTDFEPPDAPHLPQETLGPSLRQKARHPGPKPERPSSTHPQPRRSRLLRLPPRSNARLSARDCDGLPSGTNARTCSVRAYSQAGHESSVHPPHRRSGHRSELRPPEKRTRTPASPPESLAPGFRLAVVIRVIPKVPSVLRGAFDSRELGVLGMTGAFPNIPSDVSIRGSRRSQGGHGGSDL